MNTQEILIEEFEEIRKDLIKKHEELGMKASGKWRDSLELNSKESVNKSSVTITGEAYTKQLVFGRKPGSFPPIKAIEQWIIDKGIKPIESKLKISSLAFLIARKIANEGTKYFQQGGTELLDAIITPERIQKIIDRVSIFNVNVIKEGITKELRKVAA